MKQDIDYKLKNQQLCERLQRGDKTAEAELLDLNDGLIKQFVNKVRDKGMLNHMFTYDDAVQEARLALLKAATKYDFRKGAFTTYANWYMFASMRKCFECYATHIPDNHSVDYRQGRLREGVAGFVMAVINAEHLEDLAYTDFPDDLPDDVFFDEMIENPNDFTDDVIRQELRKELEKQMSGLTEREQKVLKLRFGWETGEEMTLEAVAKEMGVTRERIRQVEAKALRKLKAPERSKGLRDYLTR